MRRVRHFHRKWRTLALGVDAYGAWPSVSVTIMPLQSSGIRSSNSTNNKNSSVVSETVIRHDMHTGMILCSSVSLDLDSIVSMSIVKVTIWNKAQEKNHFTSANLAFSISISSVIFLNVSNLSVLNERLETELQSYRRLSPLSLTLHFRFWWK